MFHLQTLYPPHDSTPIIEFVQKAKKNFDRACGPYLVTKDILYFFVHSIRHPNRRVSVVTAVQVLATSFEPEYGPLIVGAAIRESGVFKANPYKHLVNSALHDCLLKSCLKMQALLDTMLITQVEEELFSANVHIAVYPSFQLTRLAEILKNPALRRPTPTNSQSLVLSQFKSRGICWNKLTLLLTKIRVCTSADETTRYLSYEEAAEVTCAIKNFITDERFTPCLLTGSPNHAIAGVDFITTLAAIMASMGILSVGQRGLPPKHCCFTYQKPSTYNYNLLQKKAEGSLLSPMQQKLAMDTPGLWKYLGLVCVIQV